MSDIPPEILAQADQEIASMDAALDKGIAQYRKEVAYRGELRALACTQKDLVQNVNGPADVDKLAWIVATALRRLATEENP